MPLMEKRGAIVVYCISQPLTVIGSWDLENLGTQQQSEEGRLNQPEQIQMCLGFQLNTLE